MTIMRVCPQPTEAEKFLAPSSHGQALSFFNAASNYLMTNTFSLRQLVEVRTPIEVEVARLAAQRREKKHVNSMEITLQTMETDSNL